MAWRRCGQRKRITTAEVALSAIDAVVRLTEDGPGWKMRLAGVAGVLAIVLIIAGLPILAAVLLEAVFR